MQALAKLSNLKLSLNITVLVVFIPFGSRTGAHYPGGRGYAAVTLPWYPSSKG